MTSDVQVSDETAEIIQRSVDKGRFPDAGTAYAESVRLLNEHNTRKVLQAKRETAVSNGAIC